MRRRERGVRKLFGVKGVGMCVAVLACREPNRGLYEPQEEVVLGPSLGALELFAGEVGSGDGEVDLDGVCDTRS